MAGIGSSSFFNRCEMRSNIILSSILVFFISMTTEIGFGSSSNEMSVEFIDHAWGIDLWARRDMLTNLPFSLVSSQDGTVVWFASQKQYRDLEKSDHLAPKSESHTAKALTEAHGETWKRQRKVMQQRVLSHGLALAEEFGEQVGQTLAQQLIEKTISGPVDIDLQEFLKEGIAQWVSGLFLGKVDQDVISSFLPFWESLRSLESLSSEKKQQLRKTFETKLQTASGGFIGYMRSNIDDNNGFKKDEVIPNAVFAMTAAFETTLDIIFWTFVGLSESSESLRLNVAKSAQKTSDNWQAIRQALIRMKTQATSGQLVDPIDKDLLIVRSILETLRVYPPVWFFSRPLQKMGADNIAEAVRLDVVLANQSTDRNWDPLVDRYLPLASFGVGKKSCPGGNAALLGSAIILSHILKSFSLDEKNSGHAVNSSHLTPNLYVDGEQLFTIRPL